MVFSTAGSLSASQLGSAMQVGPISRVSLEFYVPFQIKIGFYASNSSLNILLANIKIYNRVPAQGMA
jgi:hypothetical protein